MNRALLGIAAAAAALIVALGGRDEALLHTGAPDSTAGAIVSVAPPAQPAPPARREGSASPPGAPATAKAVENRSWRTIAWGAIGPEATRLARGGTLAEASRERLLDALARLRDAGRRSERSEGDVHRQVASARRQRAAALAADQVFREELGVPLATFLEQIEPGGVEDLPLG